MDRRGHVVSPVLAQGHRRRELWNRYRDLARARSQHNVTDRKAAAIKPDCDSGPSRAKKPEMSNGYVSGRISRAPNLSETRTTEVFGHIHKPHARRIRLSGSTLVQGLRMGVSSTRDYRLATYVGSEARGWHRSGIGRTSTAYDADALSRQFRAAGPSRRMR